MQFQQPELRSYEYIAAAASAKLVAASLTYPHEVLLFFSFFFLFLFTCESTLAAAASAKLVASSLTCPHDFLSFYLREHVAASLLPCLRRTKGVHNSLKRLVCIAGVFSLVRTLSSGMM